MKDDRKYGPSAADEAEMALLAAAIEQARLEQTPELRARQEADALQRAQAEEARLAAKRRCRLARLSRRGGMLGGAAAGSLEVQAERTALAQERVLVSLQRAALSLEQEQLAETRRAMSLERAQLNQEHATVEARFAALVADPRAIPVARASAIHHVSWGATEIVSPPRGSPISQGRYCLRGRPGGTGPPSASSSVGDITAISEISGLTTPGTDPTFDFLIARLEADDLEAPAQPIAFAQGLAIAQGLEAPQDPQEPPVDQFGFDVLPLDPLGAPLSDSLSELSSSDDDDEQL